MDRHLSIGGWVGRWEGGGTQVMWGNAYPEHIKRLTCKSISMGTYQCSQPHKILEITLS